MLIMTALDCARLEAQTMKQTHGTVELDLGELRGWHVGEEAADERERHVADIG